MSMEERYTERAVQTEGIQVRSDAVPTDDDVVDVPDAADISSSSISSLIVHTRPPTPTDVPFANGVVEGRSHSASIQTTIRTVKCPQVVYLRPAAASSQTLKSVSARIVSLPETISKYSAKQDTPGRRVVSMPERRKSPLSSPQILSPYMEPDSFIAEVESPARVRVRSVATDTPHTPSPPSSPDSVVFIANKSPLPEQFLRKRVLVNQSRTPEPRDHDWATWAKSPPRPIPALHGPLSLPYARCPSGAEGTVIEEPENLSRMIWGLDTDHTRESKEPTAKADKDIRSVAPPVARKPNSRQKPAQSAAPRFANQKERTENEVLQQMPTSHPQLLTPESDLYPTPPQPPLKFEAFEYPNILPPRGPIDLSELMRPRTDLGENAYYQGADFVGNSAFNPVPAGLHTYGSTGDLGLDWSSFVKPQDHLGSSLSGSIWSFPGNNLGDYSGTSGISSSASMRSLLSSRSPIVLDPPGQLSRGLLTQHSPLSSQHSSTLNTPALSLQGGPQRTMSALEIAQKYRHQQMMQQKHQQSMLPTPPNSSSPLWSSGFSPYQESLLSPEVLAAARLPNIQKDGNFQQSVLLQRANALQQLRTADHARLGVSGRSAQAQISFLAPAAQIQDHISDAFDLPLANDALSWTTYNRLSLYPQQPRNVTLGFLPVIQPRRSPAGPRPPSNTPNAPVGTRRPGSIAAGPANLHSSTVPPSPTSPKMHPRGHISQQNPRSVPLVRLVQRRLSVVPEEDSTVLSDNGRGQPDFSDASVIYRSAAPPGRSEGPAPAKLQHVPAEPVGVRQQKRKPVPTNPPAQPGIQQHHQAREDKSSAAAFDERTKSTGRSSSMDSIVSQRTDPPQGSKRGGYRGRGRGWRGRRANAGVHGPERVDGGLTVRS